MLLKKIKKNLKVWISSSLVLVLFISSAYIGRLVNAEGGSSSTADNKKYIEYIVESIKNAKQSNFTILEIVPAIDMGEMRYYAVGDDVKSSLATLNTKQTELNTIYNGLAGGNKVDNTYCDITSNGMSNFAFYIKKDLFNNNLYDIKMENTFLNYVVPAYYNDLKDKVKVNTKEANDLTEADLTEADLIVVTSGTHDNGTRTLYKYLFGTNSVSYDKMGTNYKEASGEANYNQFEKQGAEYISRDIPWDMVEKIWDLNKRGKDVNTGTQTLKLKVPVIMDNKNVVGLSNDTNIKRLEIILRMVTETQFDFLIPKDTTKTPYISDVKGIKNKYNIVMGLLDNKQIFESEPDNRWEQALWNHISKIDATFAYGSKDYIQDNPFAYSDYLSDDYWVYNGNSCLIPDNNQTIYVNQWSNKSFIDRVGIDQTSARVMEYLLGAIEDTDLNKITKPLKVLEIEPCNSFYYTDFATSKTFANKIGLDITGMTEANYKDYIDIVNITPNGLNGMNEDLISEYDIIIIGDNTGIMLSDSNGPVYNDSKLKGYSYLAYGDIIKLSTTLQGAFLEDYTTASKGEKVLKNVYTYFKAKIDNKTIKTKEQLFADNLANTRLSGNDISYRKSLELKDFADAGGVIVLGDNIVTMKTQKGAYPSSNIYTFITYTLNNANGIKYALRNDNELKRVNYLYEKLRPSIEVVKAPKNLEYEATKVLKDSVINTDGVLDYSFNIKGEASKEYQIKLIIDKNGDGIYRDAVADITSDDNELFYVNNFTTDTLGDTKCDIHIELPESFSGLFSWKILVTEIKEGKETLRRNSVKGAVAINQVEKNIKVLQITPDGTTGEVTLNLKNSQKFNQYLNESKAVIGYNITVNTMTTNEFEALFKGTAFNINNPTTTDQLKDYDMIVLGFADSFRLDDISNARGAVSNIEYFIDLGKALLLTHDTIAYSQTGLIKSGSLVIPTHNANNVFVGVKELSPSFFYASGMNSYSSGNAWAMDLKVLRERVGMNKHGVGLSDEEKAKDTYYTPKYLDASPVKEIQGFSNFVIYKYSLMRSFTNNTSDTTVTNNFYPYNTDIGNSRNRYDTQFQTTTVDRLNEGQVTMYPYNIDETIKVATTHSQWYQINLEPEDMVVWYTLGPDTTSNSIYYGNTRKDALSNYYIYSKGNITYTGAGHNKELENSETELKLFVNTIIKAISAGNYLPNITVTNGVKSTSGYNIYNDGYEKENEYKISFIPLDNDLNTLEMVNGDLTKVGVFSSGTISWIKDGVAVVIKDYGKGGLKNGIEAVYNITDAKQTLSTADYNKLLAEIQAGTAKLIISVSDSRKGTGTEVVNFKLRKLFELD